MIVLDASVLVAWLVGGDDEPGAAGARRLLDERRPSMSPEVLVLDLALHEVANVLVRRKRLDCETVAEARRAVLDVARVVSLDDTAADDSCSLAHRHGLSGYDAAHAAAARAHRATLVTLDDALLGAGLGITPDAAAGPPVPHPRSLEE